MTALSNIIEIHDLSKQYRIGCKDHAFQVRELLAGFFKRPFRPGRADAPTIWALKDISFSVPEGEVVGIIGRNGAGKSTLLKVLSKITTPTYGSFKVRGRVASLLEVGTGFHEELTGRENIYLNGSILGMRKREVDLRFDAIVDFSGVEQFIDTPLKRYSSGMRLRLGFAVAAHLDPDVLIVDEVLAVGDAGFQKKCLDTMEELRSGGRTVLFVSHNLAAVENLCSRGIWIDAGKVRMDAAAKDVLSAYLASYAGGQTTGSELSAVEDRLGSGEIRYTGIEYLGVDGTPCSVVKSGDPLVIRFYYHAEKSVRHPSIGFRLYTDMGTLVTETSTSHHQLSIPSLGPGDSHIDLEVDFLNLIPGRYTLSLWITGMSGKPVYDGDVRVALDVEASNIYGSSRTLDSRHGIVYFPQRWKIQEMA